MTEQKISGSFYPLTSDITAKLRKGKLTAAEWRIWSYLVEIDPWGDRYQKIETLEILQECFVSKATFYRAIAKFQELELFDFQDNGFNVRNLRGVSSLKNETTVSEMRQASQICESRLKNETSFSKMRQNSQICENQTPEPLSEKDSKSPQTLKTLKTFSDTTEREGSVQKVNFLEQEEDLFVKYQDRLRLYAIYLYVRSGEELIPNPKLEAVKKAIALVPPQKVEAGIRAFLAWIKDARNVQNQYKALESAILRGWEV
ncbi:hypothetical protein SD81_016985 [Tolypothrix campylonemoides VB511288]|nr:hypothetical protein SD81_016985 [Tolypothrix campylonemoides VB511288]